MEVSRNDVFFKDYQPKAMEKQQGRGVIKSQKWGNVVYGWPLSKIVEFSVQLKSARCTQTVENSHSFFNVSLPFWLIS